MPHLRLQRRLVAALALAATVAVGSGAALQSGSLTVSMNPGPTSTGSTVCFTVSGANGAVKAGVDGPAKVASVTQVKGGTWTVCVTVTGPGLIELAAATTTQSRITAFAGG